MCTFVCSCLCSEDREEAEVKRDDQWERRRKADSKKKDNFYRNTY